jgi:hypothetical protein
LGSVVSGGLPGVGEGGGDAGGVVEPPGTDLGGEQREQVPVDGVVEVARFEQPGDRDRGGGRGPQQGTQAQGLDVGAGILVEVALGQQVRQVVVAVGHGSPEWSVA